jgi:hypothetical protein
MRRKLFTFFSALSLLLCVPVLVLWQLSPSAAEFHPGWLLAEQHDAFMRSFDGGQLDSTAKPPRAMESTFDFGFNGRRWGFESMPDGIALTDRPQILLNYRNLVAAYNANDPQQKVAFERRASDSQIDDASHALPSGNGSVSLPRTLTHCFRRRRN